MSGICGWSAISTDPQAERDAINRMAVALTRVSSGAPKIQVGERHAFACALRHGCADIHVGDDVSVVLAGTPHVNGEMNSGGPAEAAVQAYLKHKADFLKTLRGAFALALTDRRDGTTLLAADRIGIAPLYYSSVNGALLFSSVLDAIAAHPLSRTDIDAQALYDYVYFHMVPAPRTIYRTVRRLLPGQYVVFREGNLKSNHYWTPHFEENLEQPFSELKQDFVALLQDSVRKSVDTANVGAFLSGGTDSSTIAGMLGVATGRPACTYSIGFDVDGYDEIEYARIAARHFGTRHHEYYVTPDDVAAAIPRIAEVHDQPFGNSSAVPTFYCAKLAKEDGVDTLLGGDGGDELFGGNSRYAKQYVYSRYSDLPRYFRKGLIEPLVFSLPEGTPLIGKVQRYIRNASQPMPARYDNYNLLERLGATVVFTPEFMSQVDPNLPLVEMTRSYDDAHATSLINHMLAFDLKYTLADNDLPKVTRSCELAGVGVRFPMLDEAVVSFSTQLPPQMKLKGTQLRYFFKEALRDFLPPEIIRKQKHGFGLPFGPWLQSHRRLQELTFDSLRDLKRRNVVRPDFVDRLLDTHLREHPAYYGTMAWLLMMLEQWFWQHSNAH